MVQPSESSRPRSLWGWNMVKLHRWTARAAFMGLIALAVLLASASPGSIAAGGPLPASSPSLGTAAAYSILAGSEVTNTGATTISGDVGYITRHRATTALH